MPPTRLESNHVEVREVTAAGFELYIPPSPMENKLHKSPHCGRLVILDDANDTFYNLDYDAANNPTKLGNKLSWNELALHTVPDPAIVLPENQWKWLHDEERQFSKGFLVSVESRQGGIFIGKKIGSVFVSKLKQEHMNWAALRSLKGEELPAEMRAGLLRRVWNRRSDANTSSIPYVTPAHVLDNMPRPWHRDGEWLNWELDHQFAGSKVIQPEQRWRLYFDDK